MEITKELLKEKFEEYNKLYFDNKLEMCTFNYSYFRMFGRYTQVTTAKGKVVGKIWVSKSVDWNEDMLKQIMVHEMIHHYVHTIDKVKLDGLFQHGKHFVRQIKRIKKKFGYEVLICYPNWKFKNGDNNSGVTLKVLNVLRNKMHLF